MLQITMEGTGIGIPTLNPFMHPNYECCMLNLASLKHPHAKKKKVIKTPYSL